MTALAYRATSFWGGVAHAPIWGVLAAGWSGEYRQRSHTFSQLRGAMWACRGT